MEKRAARIAGLSFIAAVVIGLHLHDWKLGLGAFCVLMLWKA